MLMVHAPNVLDSGAQHGCPGQHKEMLMAVLDCKRNAEARKEVNARAQKRQKQQIAWG